MTHDETQADRLARAARYLAKFAHAERSATLKRLIRDVADVVNTAREGVDLRAKASRERANAKPTAVRKAAEERIFNLSREERLAEHRHKMETDADYRFRANASHFGPAEARRLEDVRASTPTHEPAETE